MKKTILPLLFCLASLLIAEEKLSLPSGVLFYARTSSLMKLSQSVIMFSQTLSPEAGGKAAVACTALMMNPDFVHFKLGAPFSFVMMERGAGKELLCGFAAELKSQSDPSRVNRLFGMNVQPAQLPDRRFFFYGRDGLPPPEKTLLAKVPGKVFPQDRMLSCIASPVRLESNPTFVRTAASILFRTNSGAKAEREIRSLCRSTKYFALGLDFPSQTELALDFSLVPEKGTPLASALKESVPSRRTVFSGLPGADTWIRVVLPDSPKLRSFTGLLPENALLASLISKCTGEILVSQFTRGSSCRMKAEIALLPGTPELSSVPEIARYLEKVSGDLYRMKLRPDADDDEYPLYLEKKGTMVTLVSAPFLTPQEAVKMIVSKGDIPSFPAGNYICGIRKSQKGFEPYLQISPRQGTLAGILRIKASDLPKMQ